MWRNTTSGNTNMNKFERLMEHKGHLERLSQVKKVIDNNHPKIPSFFNMKRNTNAQKERALKIQYENQVLINKMYDIKNKISPYSQKITPSSCPAYELLSYHRLKKNISLKNENNRIFRKFLFIQPTYNIDKIEKEYQYRKYIEKNISKNRNRTNPNLNFNTFEEFNKKIRNKTFYNNVYNHMRNKNLDIDQGIKKYYYSTSRFNPYLLSENGLEEQKNDNYYGINIINSGNMKRPNSCNPHLMAKRKKLKELSEIYQSSNAYNDSQKIIRNKLNSGKKRANISRSTNACTSP